MCILQYDGNGTTQIILVYQLDIDTVIGDAAAFDVVKPINQIGDCRFSCTGPADKCDLLPRLCKQRDAVSDTATPGIGVAENDIMKAHITF